MKVKCLTNNINYFINDRKRFKELKKNYHYEDGEIALCVGKEYIVYAVEIKRKGRFYLICDEHYSWYPVFYPSYFFEVIDERLSRFWIDHELLNDKKKCVISFLRINQFKPFYELLVDYSQDEINKFLEVKKKMDEEFED